MRGLALVATLLLASSALAVGDTTIPPGSWVVLRIDPGQATVVNIWWMSNLTAAGLAGAYRNGAFLGGTLFWDQGSDAGLAVVGPHGNSAVQTWTPVQYTHPPGVGTGVPLFDDPVDVLLATFGDVRQAWYSFDKPPASVEVYASGPTWATDGRDLDSGAGAYVHAGGFAAHAGVDRTLDITVEHALMGWFAMGPFFGYASVDDATLTAPNGSVEECPCNFFQGAGPQARGPGAYRFEWDGAGAGYHMPLVAWADVRIPGPGESV